MITKVLVTGANGQLGKTIQELYATNNKKIQFTFATKLELNISIKNEVEVFFSKNNFDYCVNCAAYTNVEEAETNKEVAFKINADAVKNIAEVCKNNNTTLIHISTDYVFDGDKNEPYLEDDKTNPINEYGKSKLLGEKNIQDIIEQYFIIRTSWLYSKYRKNFAKTIIAKIQENTKLEITTSQIGTPTSCVDLVKFINHIIVSKENKYGIYHFSALGEATWYDFAVQISTHFNKSNISSVNTFNSKAKRPSYSVLNNAKASKIYKGINNWQDSVNSIVKDLLSLKTN